MSGHDDAHLISLQSEVVVGVLGIAGGSGGSFAVLIDLLKTSS
jgi:hypothetical protein